MGETLSSDQAKSPARGLSRARQAPGATSPLDAALRALADPTRRQILVMLRDREHPAGDVAAAFSSISRPAVSQHLAVLHDAALVEMRRDGTRRLYRARPAGLEETWSFIDQMWQGSLLRLKAAAERAEARPNTQRAEARPKSPRDGEDG